MSKIIITKIRQNHQKLLAIQNPPPKFARTCNIYCLKLLYPELSNKNISKLSLGNNLNITT